MHHHYGKWYPSHMNALSLDLCKHLELDSSTDPDDRYSNLFLNAYINRHAHTEYLKMIEVYSPFGTLHVFYIVLTPIYTTSGR